MFLSLLLKKSLVSAAILICINGYAQKTELKASAGANTSVLLTANCHGAAYHPSAVFTLNNSAIAFGPVIQAATKKISGFAGTGQYNMLSTEQVKVSLFYTFMSQQAEIMSKEDFDRYQNIAGDIDLSAGCRTTEHYFGFGVTRNFLNHFNINGKIGIGGFTSTIADDLKASNYSLMLNAGIGYTLNFAKKKVEIGKKK